MIEAEVAGIAGHGKGGASLEVKVERLNGEVALLSQAHAMNTRHLTDAVQAMQSQLVEVSRTTQGIALEQRDAKSHSAGLDRLGKQIEAYIQEARTDLANHRAETKTTADKVTGFSGALKVVSWVFGIIAALSAAVISIQFSAVNSKIDTAATATIASRARVDARLDRLEAKP